MSVVGGRWAAAGGTFVSRIDGGGGHWRWGSDLGGMGTRGSAPRLGAVAGRWQMGRVGGCLGAGVVGFATGPVHHGLNELMS